jgi:hypothetical protein
MTEIHEMNNCGEPSAKVANLQVELLPCEAALERSDTLVQTPAHEELDQFHDRREQLTVEVERLQTELLPYKAALDHPDTMEQGQKREIQDQYNERNRKIDSLNRDIHRLNQRIRRREQLLNVETLMAGYLADMTHLTEDEQNLNAKRQTLTTRLEEIRTQSQENIAGARQAETQAATAYAQAVAWGDVEGEKTAHADAQKAAKNLALAAEQHRRQLLIITALEQELLTINQHITELQKEHAAIKEAALRLAHMELEEQWNEAALALIEVGSKLWATARLLSHDLVLLRNLNIPGQGENNNAWTWRHVSDQSHQYRMQDLLSA